MAEQGEFSHDKFTGEAATDTGPHEFAPRRLRDRFGTKGECRYCFVLKSEHPVEWWVPSRPQGGYIPQHTWVWCPECGWELCAGGRWMGQEKATLFEAFRCSRCGVISVWDFDPPSPILSRRSA